MVVRRRYACHTTSFVPVLDLVSLSWTSAEPGPTDCRNFSRVASHAFDSSDSPKHGLAEAPARPRNPASSNRYELPYETLRTGASSAGRGGRALSKLSLLTCGRIFDDRCEPQRPCRPLIIIPCPLTP